ncbi:MAG: UbiD family decarboxylase [Aigarchaeota archaeon]|nr:UbiD family decarboxylase [Aigarchaeota archaeon]MDW8092783.1 UbiD family decarboxylase [Nitrososphaerota archaeon]
MSFQQSDKHNDLRSFLEILEREGHLRRVKNEVDDKQEIHCIMWELHERYHADAPTVLFERVKGFRVPVVKNVLGSFKRMALACRMPNWKKATKKDVVKHLVATFDARDKWLKPRIVDKKDAPCKEVIKIGENASLHELPILKWHATDGGPFILMGNAITKDPEWGHNVGTYRVHIKGPRACNVVANQMQDIGIFLNRARRRGEKEIDIAIAIGGDQALYISAGVKNPQIGRDNEFMIAGALRGEPLELVKGETVDVLVPASAEIIIEGKLSTQTEDLQDEGPFAEWMGYSGAVTKQPSIRVTAITHRKDPIFQSCISAHRYSETTMLYSIPFIRWYSQMREIVPGFKDLNMPEELRMYYAVISITKRYPGWGKNAIYAALGSGYGQANLVGVIVVDDDVDPYDMEQVLTAVSTRVDPELDIVILPPSTTHALNPSARAILPVREPGLAFAMCSRIGIDATRKMVDEYGRSRATPLYVERAPDQETLKKVREKWAQYGLDVDLKAVQIEQLAS